LKELTLQLQPFIKSAEKIDKLLTEADRQDGMRSLAKTLIGGGVLASVLAGIAGIFTYFKGSLG